ncbi:aminoimidazole riboside kinase [Streptomyces scabiei]|uniref:Aminoimidazole riboside kinase n=1 Tax=Streptomyces scabiei TaxID=1930 RepID=A0A117EGF5_STRSC|nr:aminoimidazole riboside kinase [Streptomyces scabiei]
MTAPEPSTLAVADLDESGQATYAVYADSAADWQWTDEELATTGWESPACLHTGSLALIRQPGGTRIEDPLAKAFEHVTVSIDPNVRPLLVPPAAYRERLPHWCTLADILRLSEDDLALLLPGVRPEEACDIRSAAGLVGTRSGGSSRRE